MPTSTNISKAKFYVSSVHSASDVAFYAFTDHKLLTRCPELQAKRIKPMKYNTQPRKIWQIYSPDAQGFVTGLLRNLQIVIYQS